MRAGRLLGEETFRLLRIISRRSWRWIDWLQHVATDDGEMRDEYS